MAKKARNPYAVCNAQKSRARSRWPKAKFERCCPPGTMVCIADGGFKNIEEIEKGDSVITHRGRVRPVTQVFKRSISESIYRIRVSGIPEPLTVTATHPVYAIRMLSQWRSGKSTTYSEDAEFIPANDLKVGDCIHSPSLKLEEDPVLIDEETAFILGVYCADGYLEGQRQRKSEWYCGHHRSSKRKFVSSNKGLSAVFCLSENDEATISRILRFCRDRLGCSEKVVTRENNPKLRLVVIRDRKFALFCEEMCGRGAKNKRLSGKLMAVSAAVKKSFLMGFLCGDGWLDKKRSKLMLSSTSKQLVHQLFWLAEGAGIVSTVGKVTSAGGPGNREKKSVQWILRINHSNASSMNEVSGLNLSKIRHRGRRFAMSACTFGRVLSIQKIQYEGPVYNLEVKDDQSFVANLCSVHNCVRDVKRKGR